MKRVQYRVSLLLFFCVMGVLLYLVIAYSTQVGEEDQKAYVALAEDIQRKHVARRSGEEKIVTNQVREQVKKTLFLGSSGEKLRREMRIEGSESEVQVFQKKSESRVLETYKNAVCVTQEELLFVFPDGCRAVAVGEGYVPENDRESTPVSIEQVYPKQRVRYLTADLALYDFHTQILIAYNVQFWNYLLDGHQLPKDNELVRAAVPKNQGRARSLTMYYREDGEVEFSAENLTMELVQE